MLAERGIEPWRVISQACPGLADTISEDREGSKTRSEIRRWVEAALEQMRNTGVLVLACLACTHYGYRSELFAAVFEDSGIAAKIVNPNELAVDDLFGTQRESGLSHDVTVQFATRYAIPQTALETLTWLLHDVSPKTVAALQHFVHLPELF